MKVEKRNLEQPYMTKLCVKLNEKLKRSCGDHAVLRAHVFRWHKAFLDGPYESVEDEPHSGRPCMSKTDENVTRMRASLVSDQRLTVGMIGTVVKSLVRVRPDSPDTWMLHHDDTPCHTAISVNKFLTKKHIPVVPQPPYSPDLSPRDFFLYPILKFHLTGCHFGIVDNIQKVVTGQLRALPHEDFQHDWYQEWE